MHAATKTATQGVIRRAGIEDRAVTAHRLRAGGMSPMAADGVLLDAIKAHSGHKSVAVLLGYIRRAQRWDGRGAKAGQQTQSPRALVDHEYRSDERAVGLNANRESERVKNYVRRILCASAYRGRKTCGHGFVKPLRISRSAMAQGVHLRELVAPRFRASQAGRLSCVAYLDLYVSARWA